MRLLLVVAALATLAPACEASKTAPPANPAPPDPTPYNPPPVLTSFSPSSVAPGGPRLTLTVIGSAFVQGTILRWNGADRPTIVDGPRLLHASIAAEDVATPGSSSVTLYSPPLGGSTSNPMPFVVGEVPVSTQAVSYQIDPAHSGLAHALAPVSFPASAAWTVNLDGLVSYPLIAGGKVFVLVSGAGGAATGARLYALDLSTGATVWGPAVIEGPFDFAGHAYEAGKVFVAGGWGEVRAYDAESGALGWTLWLPDDWVVSAPPTAAGGVVYVGAVEVDGTLYAVDERDGSITWKQEINGGDNSSPAVGPDGVFVSYPCQAYKFDRSYGTLLWHYDGPCYGGGGLTAAYASGSLYVRDYWAFGPGEVPFGGRRHDGFDGGYAYFGCMLSNFPIPAFDANSGYLLSWAGLAAMDLDLVTARWTFVGDGQLSSAPLVLEDVVIVGSRTGSVYAVDAVSGAVRWSGTAPAAISAPDEQNTAGQPLTGLAAGEDYLVVPAGTTLTAWKIAAP